MRTSVGWIDVIAILVVIAILAFALGEIATGRVRDLTFRSRVAVLPQPGDAPAPSKAPPSKEPSS